MTSGRHQLFLGRGPGRHPQHEILSDQEPVRPIEVLTGLKSGLQRVSLAFRVPKSACGTLCPCGSTTAWKIRAPSSRNHEGPLPKLKFTEGRRLFPKLKFDRRESRRPSAPAKLLLRKCVAKADGKDRPLVPHPSRDGLRPSCCVRARQDAECAAPKAARGDRRASSLQVPPGASPCAVCGAQSG